MSNEQHTKRLVQALRRLDYSIHNNGYADECIQDAIRLIERISNSNIVGLTMYSRDEVAESNREWWYSVDEVKEYISIQKGGA